MNGIHVKVTECIALIDNLSTRTFGTFYVDDWIRLIESDQGRVKLSARSTTSDLAPVDFTDSELMSKLAELAAMGTGHVGAEHNGAEFRFDNL